MLISWIHFDTAPTTWWLIAHLSLAFLTFRLIRHQQSIPDRFFIFAICFITGWARFPVFSYNLPLNPDESQLLAQGLTLAYDPVLYRSVDPTTSGPCNSFLLTFLHVLGFKLDFHLAHILSWALTLLSLVLIYKALKRLQLGVNAQLALIPAVAFFSFIQNSNYTHYYSESLSIVFLSLNVYFMTRWITQQTIPLWEVIVSGVSTALIVLCKIQAVPLAFVLAVGSMVLLFSFHKTNFIRYAGTFTLSVLGIWALWVAHMAISGVAGDFYFYYIKANAIYKKDFSDGSPRPTWLLWAIFPLIIYHTGKGLEYFCYPFIALGAICVVRYFYQRPWWKAIKADHYFWLIIAVYLAAVIATIIRTGSFYAHHFIYLILPASLIMGLFLSQLPHKWKWITGVTQLIYFSIFLADIVTRQAFNLHPTNISDAQELSPVGRTILKYGKPGEYLVVWGWDCQYHVETQMPQGVNENHCIRTAMKHPLQETYYKRYLRDLKRSAPPVFVDAITAKTLWMSDPARYGHQNYPELSQYIADNYQLKANIEGVRVYARNVQNPKTTSNMEKMSTK